MFTRVVTIGDGAFVWSSSTVLATVRAGDDELRTIHEDGVIVAWSAAGAPRVCVRTRETRRAAWVDERLAILDHASPSERELRAIDEPSPRWTVPRGSNDPIVVLPCKTMFYRDGLGHRASTIHSLADGSALEQTRDRWVAMGRHATYRCVALVIDLGLAGPGPPGGAPWSGPETVQLRVLALAPGVDEPRLVRVLSERRWSECSGAGDARLAVTSDGAIGIDAVSTDPVLRVWDIGSGAFVSRADGQARDAYVSAAIPSRINSPVAGAGPPA